jgi:hypothetical protein
VKTPTPPTELPKSTVTPKNDIQKAEDPKYPFTPDGRIKRRLYPFNQDEKK